MGLCCTKTLIPRFKFNMKKITIPFQQEEAVYYSDFSGRCFGEMHPDAELQMTFNYGSKYDGSNLTIHLTDKEAQEVIEYIKSRVTEDFKIHLNKILEEEKATIQQSLESRDYIMGQYTLNSAELYKDLLK